MEHNVLCLCASAPSLLGKYAWRYPGYAAQVTNPIAVKSSEQSETNGLDESNPHATLLLWNLLGVLLAKGSAKTATIKWRNGSKKSDEKPVRPAPSPTECQTMAWSIYATLCKNAASIISKWKTRRAAASDDVSVDDKYAESWGSDLTCLEEFNNLCQYLSDLSFVLLPIFCFEMMDESVGLDGDVEKSKMMVRKMVVNSIQQSLTGWVNSEPSTDKGASKVKTDDDNHDKAEEDYSNVESSKDRLRQQRPRLEDDAVARIRKSVKVMQSAIDSCGSGALNGNSSMGGGSMRFSSKAD